MVGHSPAAVLRNSPLMLDRPDDPRRLDRARGRTRDRRPRLHRRRVCPRARRRDLRQDFADRRQGVRRCRRLRRGGRGSGGQGGPRRVRVRRLARRRPAAQEGGAAPLRRAHSGERRRARPARDARRRQGDRQHPQCRRALLRQLHPVLRRARRQALRRGRAARSEATSRWCGRSRSASSARSCRGTIR